jgi:hypothetical protein
MTCAWALAAFTLRRLFAGRRFAAAVAILALPPVVCLLMALLGREPAEHAFHRIMIELTAYLGALLLSLVYAIALTTSEIEDGTAGYVMLGAAPKWMVALIQVVVTAAGLAAMASVSIGVSWMVFFLGAETPPAAILTWRYALVTGVAILAYLSCFVVCGIAFRRGIAVCVALAVVWEAMIVRMPMKFAAFTITNNVRALIVSLTLEGNPRSFVAYTQGAYDFPLYSEGAMFLSVVVAAALSLGMVASMNRSLVSKES